MAVIQRISFYTIFNHIYVKEFIRRNIEINGSTERCIYFARPPGTVCAVRTDIILNGSTGQNLNKIKCIDPIIHQ